MELIFTKPDLRRYTQRPFPPYRYLPFQTNDHLPHPRTDPAGHSYHDTKLQYQKHDLRTVPFYSLN